MTGTAAAVCGCGVLVRSSLQIHSLDRHGSSYGVWNRSITLHQRVCKGLTGRESMLDRPVRYRHICNSAEPDWDAEMSLFRKRTMKPNQMETVRRLEEEVDIGKVLFSDDGLAILEGLNNDAPVGSSLRFVSGASGVLLWRRSDNVCFALILGGAQNVTAGDRVECRLKGILQVEDDAEGPATKREYEVARVPVGVALNGQAVNFLGCPQGSQFPLGMDAQLPLLNDQLDMKSREQINTPLFTGVKALDTLTPLGRGQAQLLVGPAASGKTSLAVDAIIGQHALQRAGQAPVRCVYASVGHSQQEVDDIVAELGQAGAMRHTTVISAPQGRGLGERYAALCTALAVGEKVRDQGGHSFVVLDDISCMGAMWEAISRALASLGPEALALSSSQQPLLSPEGTDPEAEDPEALVEYEGMLVSASAAQRRRFFSSLIQRSAQVHRRLKGGSMTMLAILPGQPAKGERQPAAAAEDYLNLTPAQRDKLLAALAKRQPPKAETLPGCVTTEVVEEFMSIADGQLVLTRESRSTQASSASGEPSTSQQGPTASQHESGQHASRQGWQGLTGSNVDVSASVSRIGCRAYPPAMATLAPSIRFDLAQAVDANRFGTDRAEASLQHQQLQRAALLEAALAQPARQPVPLEEQVAQLYALQKGYLDNESPDTVQQAIMKIVSTLRHRYPDALERIRRTQCLGPMAEAVLKAALVDICSLQPQSAVSSV